MKDSTCFMVMSMLSTVFYVITAGGEPVGETVKDMPTLLVLSLTFLTSGGICKCIENKK